MCCPTKLLLAFDALFNLYTYISLSNPISIVISNKQEDTNLPLRINYNSMSGKTALV